MNIALFDLDNTLLRGDSDYNWAKFLIKKNILDQEAYEKKNEIFYQDYQNGTLDVNKYCEFQFRIFKENKYIKLDLLRKEYVETIIRPLITKKSVELVNFHKSRGDLCIIITATNSFITQPIAELFNIQHLIGTDPEIIDGEFTGKVKGIPSFQEGKVLRLNHWLKDNNYDFNTFKESYFYSDSRNDLPLLKIVNHPICVQPDEVLENEAKKNNWQIISLLD